MANQNNGDILMLEAPPSSYLNTSSNAEVIDALPYIDDDYADPQVKKEVDRLIEEEMRRSTKKPSDFLNDLPPLEKFNLEDYPMVAREYERVRAGRPPVSLDRSRYELENLTGSRRSDENACKQSLQRVQRLLQYQTIRIENLDLLLKYGPVAWRMQIQRLEALVARMQKLVQEQNEKIEKVNRERKYQQQTTANTLHALSSQWRELCQKNMEIEAACAATENQIRELKLEAEERGWKLECAVTNGPMLHSQI